MISADLRLRARVQADQQRIAAGERPVYHVSWTTGPDAVDVTIRELPLIHLFVPDAQDVPEGARGLVSRTLAVDPSSFDLVTEESTST